MAYSAKLIKEVKELYPNSKDMHKLADSGNAFLGRYLDDSCEDSLPLDTILLATSLESLQQKARDMKRKVELYEMWCDEDPRRKMY
jgi:hypothetical protein